MKRKNIKRFFRPLQSEDGSVIVIVLIILVVLTLIGISATNTSVVELQIASNDHFHKIAFYNADAGIYGTAKLISGTLDNSAGITSGFGTDAPGITYLIPPPGGTNAIDFYEQIMGFNKNEPGFDENGYDGGLEDIRFPVGSNNVEVDVQRLRQENIVGGGAEFGTGSAGPGTVSIAIFSGVDADGAGPRSSVSNLIAEYRKVVGMAGGL